MTTQVTATEAKARLLRLLDEVETGQQVEITRRGKTIARIVPVKPPRRVEGFMAGIAVTADPEDDLLSIDEEWEFD